MLIRECPTAQLKPQYGDISPKHNDVTWWWRQSAIHDNGTSYEVPLLRAPPPTVPPTAPPWLNVFALRQVYDLSEHAKLWLHHRL